MKSSEAAKEIQLTDLFAAIYPVLSQDRPEPCLAASMVCKAKGGVVDGEALFKVTSFANSRTVAGQPVIAFWRMCLALQSISSRR